MPVQTEHRFPLDLSVLDAAGSRVTLADLRGQARAVAVYFMRTGTCPVCIHHARTLARLDLPTHDVQPVVVVPARRRTPPGSGASSATGSPSCPPTAPRRTWPRDCTGPCSFNTVASCSSTPPASCDTGWRPPCPPAASTAQRCRPRSTGRNAPTILPQRATKG
jgi:hypothetical protein